MLNTEKCEVAGSNETGFYTFCSCVATTVFIVSHHSTNECSILVCHQGLAGTVGPFLGLPVSPCSQILAVHTVTMTDLSTFTTFAQYEKHQHTIQQNLCNISLASCDFYFLVVSPDTCVKQIEKPKTRDDQERRFILNSVYCIHLL
jgi:hypothetical protein